MAAEAQLDPGSLSLPVFPSPAAQSGSVPTGLSGNQSPVTHTGQCPSLCPHQPQSLSALGGARLGPHPELGLLPAPEPEQSLTPHKVWEGSSVAGTSCQERAAVVLLGNELKCLIPALFQPHSIPQSPRPGLPARDLPAGLSRGAEEQQHPLGPLLSFLGTRPGCLCCSFSSWLLPLL